VGGENTGFKHRMRSRSSSRSLRSLSSETDVIACRYANEVCVGFTYERSVEKVEIPAEELETTGDLYVSLDSHLSRATSWVSWLNHPISSTSVFFLRPTPTVLRPDYIASQQ
jgi:hypothetical protein